MGSGATEASRLAFPHLPSVLLPLPVPQNQVLDDLTCEDRDQTRSSATLFSRLQRGERQRRSGEVGADRSSRRGENRGTSTTEERPQPPAPHRRVGRSRLGGPAGPRVGRVTRTIQPAAETDQGLGP